eukprot:scaffold28313_cov21-Tisochrysis_lutea.AAC.1
MRALAKTTPQAIAHTPNFGAGPAIVWGSVCWKDGLGRVHNVAQGRVEVEDVAVACVADEVCGQGAAGAHASSPGQELRGRGWDTRYCCMLVRIVKSAVIGLQGPKRAAWELRAREGGKGETEAIDVCYRGL